MDYIIEEMYADIDSRRVHAAIWVMDRNHIYRAANLNALRLFGMSTYE